ncbi:MAG: YkgJ family cysteine cluster protein [Candidatus Lokiarchaeota archaeon]|nr:YkgJ family cysteine cluster protein [Candidatus Lokiarchaeota archaeon]
MTSTEIKLSKALENGIEFSCQMCGECCRGFDEGEVYLYQEDIERLIKSLNLTKKSELKKFAKTYLKVVDDSFLWKEPGAERGRTYRYKSLGFKFRGDDEHCQFLIDKICSIHEARPFQCRCFPFWQMLVSNRKNFINYSKKCPGLKDLKGHYYSKEEILEWANKEYEMEKQYFLEMKKHKFNILKVYPFLSKDMLDK